MSDHVVIYVHPLYTLAPINKTNIRHLGKHFLAMPTLLPTSVKNHPQIYKAIHQNSAISPVLDTRYYSPV